MHRLIAAAYDPLLLLVTPCRPKHTDSDRPRYIQVLGVQVAQLNAPQTPSNRTAYELQPSSELTPTKLFTPGPTIA